MIAGPARTLSTPAIVVASRVSIDANGDVAALCDQSGTPHRVLANSVLSGAVGAAVSPGDGLAGERVAAGPPGGPVAVVLWENIEAASGQDALQSTEYGRRLALWSIDGALRFTLWTLGLGWRPAAVIAASTGISVLTGPRLVAGGNGTALLVWAESMPAALSTQTGLRVAADWQGHGAVVWQHTPGDPSDPATVRSLRYRNGVWEALLVLSEIAIKPSLVVHPALEPNGTLVVTWTNPVDGSLWSSRGRIE